MTGIPVAQGEVVDFLVAAQTYYGLFVGLDENIAFTPIPEPNVGPQVILGFTVAARLRGCCFKAAP